MLTEFSFLLPLQDVSVAGRDGRGSEAALPRRMVADSAVTGHDKVPLSSPPLDGQQPQAGPQPEALRNWASRGLSPRLFPTHFPTFKCQEDCKVIADTASKLERCGFYWGPLGVEDAHRMLGGAPLGSYLIRDSRQKDVFFTLSYHAKSGPVSVRIIYSRQKFSLACNQRSFPTLFALLEYYSSSPKKSLSAPYRRWQPSLQELCRKRIMGLMAGGGSQIPELPITRVAQDFLSEFPYRL